MKSQLKFQSIRIRLIVGLITVCWSSFGLALSTPPWLYSVDVEVTNQSSAEREQAARTGLLAVLTRVSGLTSIPRSEAVRTALKNAARYYDEFVFVERDDPANPGLALRISYQPDAVLDLVRAAELPIWWTRRPSILAWIVVDELDERMILDANTTHPLGQALQEAAMARGLNLELPLMDLEDHLKVNATDIWGHSGLVLDQLAQKYGTDVSLVGRVQTELTFRGRDVAGDWTFWLDGKRVQQAFDSDQYPELATAAVDALAVEMMARYSVAALRAQRWEIRVSGLRGGRPYADLMRYLEDLDFIDEVTLKALQADVATLVLVSRARADQLLELLVAENQLTEDSLYLGRGVQLMWRG